MKKFVVFDLDGTLVNSIYDLADCVDYALAKHSLPQNSLEEYYSFVGHGMENLVRTSMKSQGGNDELYKKVRKDFDERYALHSSDKTVAYEGLEEILAKLTAQGIKTAVLTNKADVFVDAILKKCFPHHSFLLAWGQKEGMKRKPDPESLFKLIEQAGYALEDCVYVGDSEVDVQTAINAGMDLVAVNWGFRSESVLVESGAGIIAGNAQELFDKIISL